MPNYITDNQDNLIEKREEIQHELLIEHKGNISEALISAVRVSPIIIQGVDSNEIKREFRLSLDPRGRFLNAELMKFGHPTGRRVCVGLLTDNGGWYYTAKFRAQLENIESESHWVAKIHLYFRV